MGSPSLVWSWRGSESRPCRLLIARGIARVDGYRVGQIRARKMMQALTSGANVAIRGNASGMLQSRILKHCIGMVARGRHAASNAGGEFSHERACAL